MKPARATVGVIAVLLLCASCSPSVDLKQALRITDISGGWFDDGIQYGRNKLVPTVSFRVKSTTGSSIRPLSLNIVFKKIGGPTEEDFDDVFLQTVELDEGGESKPMTARAPHGYTGDPPQTRAEMLANSQFRDMRVVFFAKHSSGTWVELGRYDIPRQLLTK